MLDEIWVKIVLTIVGIITTGSCGYLSARIKIYKQRLKKKEENEVIQNEALRAILKNQLTNIYFVYSELKEIPDYAYQNFKDLLTVYEGLGGDGFIHTLDKKMESWKITKTGILK